VVVLFFGRNSSLGQAGAGPTQRGSYSLVSPDRTSIYPQVDGFAGITFRFNRLCSKIPPNGGNFRITDWRGGERPPVAERLLFAGGAPLGFRRASGDPGRCLNFQVGRSADDHWRTDRGKADSSRPPGMKVESILYLFPNPLPGKGELNYRRQKNEPAPQAANHDASWSPFEWRIGMRAFQTYNSPSIAIPRGDRAKGFIVSAAFFRSEGAARGPSGPPLATCPCPQNTEAPANRPNGKPGLEREFGRPPCTQPPNGYSKPTMQRQNRLGP